MTNSDIISSDEYRGRFCGDASDQSKNQEIFQLIYKDMKSKLSNGSNVIFDATNLSIKDRKQAVEIGKKYASAVIAYVMTTPFTICHKQNFDRERQVPEFVLEKQLHKFQIPFKEEGFDIIYLDKWFGLTFPNKGNLDVIQNMMIGFDQKNPHHKFELDEHCIYCCNKVTDLCLEQGVYNKDFIQSLGRAALIHDIGKVFSQSFGEDGIAHYYEHHNIGAYSLLQNLDLIPADSYDQLLDILFYVNYHMLPFSFSLAKEKAIKKYQLLFGDTKFKGLMLLNEADQFTSQNKFILE